MLSFRSLMAFLTIRLNAAPVSGCLEVSPFFAARRIAVRKDLIFASFRMKRSTPERTRSRTEGLRRTGVFFLRFRARTFEDFFPEGGIRPLPFQNTASVRWVPTGYPENTTKLISVAHGLPQCSSYQARKILPRMISLRRWERGLVHLCVPQGVRQESGVGGKEGAA